MVSKLVHTTTNEGPKREGAAMQLTLMTLNIAHGRGVSAHQLFLPESAIRVNLRKVSQFMAERAVDIAALQECDICSRWNGSFNQLQMLSDDLPDRRFGVTAEHMKNRYLSYGTALLSKLELRNSFGATFTESLPMPRKGYVMAELGWPGDPDFRFLVVSLHLDFIRQKIRLRQVRELGAEILKRQLPTIVMGDFNSQWTDRVSAVKALSDKCSLTAFRPKDLTPTFALRRKRWDWIMLSPEFSFENYDVSNKTLSDHLAVIVDIIRVET